MAVADAKDGNEEAGLVASEARRDGDFDAADRVCPAQGAGKVSRGTGQGQSGLSDHRGARQPR